MSLFVASPLMWSTWLAGRVMPLLLHALHSGSPSSTACLSFRHAALLVARVRLACLSASGGQCLRLMGENGLCLPAALGIRTNSNH
jgi:hypothetical protein